MDGGHPFGPLSHVADALEQSPWYTFLLVLQIEMIITNWMSAKRAVDSRVSLSVGSHTNRLKRLMFDDDLLKRI